MAAVSAGMPIGLVQKSATPISSPRRSMPTLISAAGCGHNNANGQGIEKLSRR